MRFVSRSSLLLWTLFSRISGLAGPVRAQPATEHQSALARKPGARLASCPTTPLTNAE